MLRLARAIRTVASVLLGLFVVWQLVFLFSTNLLRMARALLPDREDLPGVETVLRGWEGLTKQEQTWGLFAPNVAEIIPFPAVELRWDDPALPPRLLLSDNEPADPSRFLRFGHYRVRRYESALEVQVPLHDGTFDPAGEEWRSAIVKAVRQEGERMETYLRWRSAAFHQGRPDLPPPDEAVLHLRLYRVPPPPGPQPWDWQYLGQQRVARWRAERLEVFDPVRRRFERLKE